MSTLLRAAAPRLAAAGVAAPQREARLLAAHVAGTDLAGLLRAPDQRINAARFATVLARRVAREPLAYITGQCGFWTLDLAVSPATLIPRADSETLIEAAITARPDPAAVRRVLDLGTGTGCLLLAALAVFPNSFGIGIDRIEAACSLARCNAAANQLDHRCAILCGSWGAAVDGRFDLILSNPPYIARAEIPTLMAEVGRYEPAAALDGGLDGTDAYRALLAELPGLLAPGGIAIWEVGSTQTGQVASLAAAAGWSTSVRADLAGHARALMLQRRED